MKLHLQFFSHLKDIVGASSLDLELAEGATVSALLEDLYVRFPKLRAWDNSILIGAGVEFVERDYVIKKGDEIAIMPPVQGG
jgi:MoaD family protein